MNKKLRVAQYGCGKMSEYTMRYVYEKGAEIVAAFDINPNVIGKDIGELLGGESKDVIISDIKSVQEVFQTTKPDICIVTTMSLLSDIEGIFEICAKNGINAISTCEEAFFPWNSAYEITKRIDEIAKENNCTLCGSGYQDIFWGNLITTLAGATHKIKKIKGISSYNVEDYGIALAQVHGAGLDLDEFQNKIASADNVSDEERQAMIDNGTFLASYMWTVNGWLCSQLGLTVTRQTQKCIPHTYKEDLYSETLNLTIPAGYATGMSAVVITETEEGVILENECIGKVYAPEECDKNDWTIIGEPETQVVITRPNTVELTCATIVNRLSDVINAPAGYITTEKMPKAEYKAKALDEYVK